jgi:hypothetical protein
MARHAVSHAEMHQMEIEDAVIRSRDRLCVVYRRDHRLQVWGRERASRYDVPPERSEFDVAQEVA